MIFTRTNVKISIAFTLLAVLTLAGCKAPPPPVTDDTVVSSVVDGVTLTHRYAVKAPASFTPVNENYRALYNASVMTRPDYSGKVVRYLENGKPFLVLGEVENRWFAIADVDEQQLIGYVPLKAGVKSDLYDATLRSDRPRPRKNSKKVCVDVGGKSKACRNNNTATWILE
ncbi:SH3 domain-containing protein [Erwinia sp. MYb375]|uniref:SH3 domain-containing protein n=1 Tax=Erwinia sp. MYb375 TaxID=2745272 RepID=UPI003098064E